MQALSDPDNRCSMSAFSRQQQKQMKAPHNKNFISGALERTHKNKHLVPFHSPRLVRACFPSELYQSISLGLVRLSILQMTTGWIWLLFQNVTGLTQTMTKEFINCYLQCIQGLKVDIVGLSKTNTCWFNQPSKDMLVIKVRWPLVPDKRIY